MAVPLCQYFGVCGGCSTQHIDYAVQLQNKKKNVAAAIKTDKIKVFSGSPYNYRNRLEVFFHPKGFGLRKRANPSRIVDIGECVISEPGINALVAEMRLFFSEPVCAELGNAVKHAILRTASGGNALYFNLNGNALNLAGAMETLKLFAQKAAVKNVALGYADPENGSVKNITFKGSMYTSEKYLDFTFLHSIDAFFQNNHAMANELHQYCNALLKKYKTSNASLLDLYGGVGTFGIINASLFREVTIVESVSSAIESAKKNILENNVKNVRAVLLDASRLRKIPLNSPLFVITDPPRSGMDTKTILRLKELQPETIIYVSCNVEQLKKDIPRFNKYKIQSAALFDFFPQTNHVEVVVELVKR